MKPIDRRITRTQSAIQEALFSLLEQRSIDKITIQDVTNLANVNRSTFYLHYIDIYQLLEQVETDILSTIMDIGKQTNDLLENKMDPSTLSHGITNVFIYIKNNSRKFKLLLGSTGSQTFQSKIITLMKKNAQLLLTTLFSDQLKQTNLDYLLAFVATANLGLIKHWIDTDMQKSPSELADLMSTLIVGGITNLISSQQKQI
jgi:AcrR family transcriptional regulator